MKATLEKRNSYQLANLADCATPDLPDSPGSQFLLSVQIALEECLDYCDDIESVREALPEYVDGLVPTYTHDVWTTFVDLAAYQEDPTELGCDGSDMEKSAKVSLYLIGERLWLVLVDEIEGEEE